MTAEPSAWETERGNDSITDVSNRSYFDEATTQMQYVAPSLTVAAQSLGKFQIGTPAHLLSLCFASCSERTVSPPLAAVLTVSDAGRS
jgi:hypothetical protein